MSHAAPRGDALEAAYRHLHDLQRAGRPADQRSPRDEMAAAVLRPGDVAVAIGTGTDPHTRYLADLVRGPGGLVQALEPDAASAATLAGRLAAPAYRHVRVRHAPGRALARILARLPRLPWLRLAIEDTTPALLAGAREEILRLRPLVSLTGRMTQPALAGDVFDTLVALDLLPFDMLGHTLAQRDAFLLAAHLRAVTEWVAVPAEQGAPPAPAPIEGGSPPRRILIVPGLAKAGTTFLFDQLAQQPALFGPSLNKEVNYFLRTPAPRRERYLDLFPSWDPAQVLVDASPAYLQNGKQSIAARIRDVLARDAVAVLVLLRDPIDALLSHYLHDLKSQVGPPDSRARRPAAHRLTDAATFAHYAKPRAPAVAGFRAAFGDACRGAPMAGLFDCSIAALLGSVLGLPVAPFDATRPSNPGGFVPRYIHGGPAGAVLEQDGAAWRVPPRALVFVAEERSQLVHDMPDAEAAALLALGASFTTAATLPRAAFAPVEEDHRAICGILGMTPLIRDHGAEIVFTPRPARASAAVLAQLQPA